MLYVTLVLYVKARYDNDNNNNNINVRKITEHYLQTIGQLTVYLFACIHIAAASAFRPPAIVLYSCG